MSNAPSLQPSAIRPGMTLPTLLKTPGYMTLVEYAGASRDYYDIHHDRDAARAAGHRDVVVQGSLKAAYVGQLMTDWIGDAGRLASLTVQYRGGDVPDEPLAVTGVVTDVACLETSVDVTCEVWVENPAGIRTLRGTAIAVFSR